YTGARYTIDRWRSWDSGFSMTVSDGGIVVSGGMFTQYIGKSLNGIYTLAAMTSSGTLYLLTANMNDAMTYEGNLGMGTPSDGVQAVSIGPGTYIWVALYEGSYTAEPLPPYVPKGYAAELAECQRYFRQIGAENASSNVHVGYAQAATTTVANGIVSIGNMRLVTPSYVLSGTVNLRNGATDISASISGLSIHYGIAYIQFSASGLTVGQNYAIRLISGAKLQFSADL
ncbi:MAG: hypothetical protein ACI4OY_05860, partial [Aristaeellaceae bacterium]